MIPISRSTEHALRALTYLAQKRSEDYHLARTMAVALEVPAPFLGKCLQPLVARGILESQRGRNGGFRLSSPPKEISLYQIVDALEHLARPRRCFLGQAECTDERACPMHEYWKRASGDFHEILLTTTLADVESFCASNPASGYPAFEAD